MMKEQITQNQLYVKTLKAHKGNALTYTYIKEPMSKAPWYIYRALLATHQTHTQA